MEQTNREYQRVIQYLCREIRAGTISVGDRLPTERAIAETLQLSRNSTREALRSLEHVGVIESVGGSGSYFTGNVAKKFSDLLRLLILVKLVTQREICDFRRMMEKALCGAIVERGAFDAAAAEALLAQPVQSVDEEIEKDQAFHYLLIQASDNHFFLELMSAVAEVYREWIGAVLRGADDETKACLAGAHRDLLEALKQRDRTLCEAAIDRHYDLIDRALAARGSGQEISL